MRMDLAVPCVLGAPGGGGDKGEREEEAGEEEGGEEGEERGPNVGLTSQSTKMGGDDFYQKA